MASIDSFAIGLANACDNGIIVVDSNRQIVIWNSWMERISRVPTPNAKGKRVTDIYPEVEDTRITGAIEMALDMGLSTILSHTLNRNLFPLTTKKEGSIRIEHSVMVQPFDRGTSDNFCLLQVFDVSNIVVREKLLRQAKEEAVSASNAKSEFLATMSHELRTPMTGVMGFADMLLEDDLAEESKEKLFHIKDSTRSLLTLLNEILDLSKLEAGKMEVENIDFNLPSLINEVQGLFVEKREDKRRKNVETIAEMDGNVPEIINADPTSLRQILINLIGNAIKFTETGSVNVSTGLFQPDTGKKILRFEVKDTGIGISQDAIDNLFKDFTQADASISRKYQGSGLGLSICKRLVTIMGGEIGVESQLGIGSTFWFTLPYISAKSEMGLKFGTTKTVKYEAQRSLYILVAEDNHINQRIIQATMESYGHHVELSDDGAEAMEAHQEKTFDLILMDIRMPVMSGTDATRMIRQLDGKKGLIPIVALTADAMTEHKKDYFDAGMNMVVSKPIDRGELLEAINQVMDAEIHKPVTVEVAIPDAAESSEASEEEPADPGDVDPDIEDFLQQLKSAADE